MFNSKLKASLNEAGTGTTIVGSGTIITGNIESMGDIRIDGMLVGDINVKAKLLVGPDGVVQGNIQCEQADILGKVIGKIKVNDLVQLRGEAVIAGDIYAGKLHVEPFVIFNGQCHMGTPNTAIGTGSTKIVGLKEEMTAAV
ncbi:MAG TPA: polymer-forming cytoskeletal protein [Ferruginibacter sp.]|jgi:cytoskeletal protein CcmA (bactofilin family)|nr:polymer-forming cytoskeletal protein [Ferruginibacter sp.]